VKQLLLLLLLLLLCFILYVHYILDNLITILQQAFLIQHALQFAPKQTSCIISRPILFNITRCGTFVRSTWCFCAISFVFSCSNFTHIRMNQVISGESAYHRYLMVITINSTAWWFSIRFCLYYVIVMQSCAMQLDEDARCIETVSLGLLLELHRHSPTANS